jgi:hypothetical protein
MNAEEYKSLINEKDVLDHTTLNVTLKELVSRQEFELAAAIKRILEVMELPNLTFMLSLMALQQLITK